jgi:hypothetical protein
MTALILVAALFGGALWAGRSRRVYREPYIVDDVDVYCESSCDDSCASDSYDSSSEDRDD